MPDVRNSAGTGYEGHEFFEASSIRKINGKYYFVYSSIQSHELCYAVSDRPMKAIPSVARWWISETSFYMAERKGTLSTVSATPTAASSAPAASGYVFYHRQTNRTNFSRQACAEKIYFDEKGRIAQAGSDLLRIKQRPPACRGRLPRVHLLPSDHRRPEHLLPSPGYGGPFPLSDPGRRGYHSDGTGFPETAQKDAAFPVQYVKNMRDQSTMGFKYFDCKDVKKITLTLRGRGSGHIVITDTAGAALAKGSLSHLRSDPRFRGFLPTGWRLRERQRCRTAYTPLLYLDGFRGQRRYRSNFLLRNPR